MREYAAPFFYGYKLPGLPSSLGRSFFFGRMKTLEDDKKLLTLPAARPEFTNLSEARVWKAIVDDPEQGTAIAAEVTRLMVECMKTFKAHVGKDGPAPSRLLRIGMRCPIEAVAALLAAKYIEDEAGAACEVTVH